MDKTEACRALADALRGNGAGFRPAVMWFWNDALDEDEITFQLEAFLRQGVEDFFVNHVWSATDEYLSDRFFKAVRHAVREAARLGLSYWIYDEFNWPSGTAGGRLLAEHPEKRAGLLQSTVEELYPGKRVRDLHVPGRFEAAQLVYRAPDGEGSRCIDVSEGVTVSPDRAGGGFYLSYRHDSLADAALYVISSDLQRAVLEASMWGRHSGFEPGYIDPLDPSAIRLFLDSTHERYKREIGEEFGRTVKGLFTDEICVGSHPSLGLGRIPWNDSLGEAFRQKYGFALRPWYYALFAQCETAREKQVRYCYWRLLTGLVRDAYVEQARAWCDGNGLLYTGHFCGEEYLKSSMYQSGDLLELMARQDIPGIDSIFSRAFIDNEDFNVPGKLAGSCARIFGRSRVLCETYTGSSWQLRFDDMRRVANRLVVLGVNMIQYMGAYYSLDNQRKALPICYPPSHGYNNPLFEHYGAFGDYVARLQKLSHLTRPCGRILLVAPQSGCYANADAQAPIFAGILRQRGSGAYDAALMTTVNALLELNVEFDICSDAMAAGVEASRGEARLGCGRYDTVVLLRPDDTTSEVVGMIGRLGFAGVGMVFIDALPRLCVDTAEPVSPLGETPGAFGVTRVSNGVCVVRCPDGERFRGSNAGYRRMLLDALGQDKITLDIRHGGAVYTGRRRNGGAELVFVANDAGEPQAVSMARRQGMRVYDPWSGDELAPDRAGGRISLVMAPRQLLVVIIPDAEAGLPAAPERKKPAARARTLGGRCAIRAEGGNMLRAAWRYAPGAEGPGIEESALEPMEELRLPERRARPGAGGALVWDFRADHLPGSALLLAETGGVSAVFVNGEKAVLEPCRLWGVHNAKVEIARLLRAGSNRVVALFTAQDFPSPYLAPFFLLRGDFETDGADLTKPSECHTAAPLNRQGFPHLAGGAVYRFTAALTEAEARAGAALSVPSLDAATLFVNGTCAGTRLWAPYDFDVGGLLTEGENSFEIRLAIPLANLMADPMDCGLTGAPSLILR